MRGPPVAMTPLVGRDAERAAALAALRAGARLVSLVGLGGIGKTRLALALAEAIAGARAVAWCDAATARSPDDLAAALALALGVEASPYDQHPSAFEALAQAATRAPHVVVIDGLEGLTEEARAELVAWLGRSAATAVVVTSRHDLGVPGEHVVAVAPLPTASATALLLARAREARPGWGAGLEDCVARLAELVDGVPLALELVGALARTAGPLELEAILREGAMPRIGLVSEAIVGWSWRSLPAEAAADLACVAAQDGALDLELAAAALGVDRGGALARLEPLVRRSLLLVDEHAGVTRYRALDLVRAFVGTVSAPEVARAARARVTEALLGRNRGMLGGEAPSGATAEAFVVHDAPRLTELVLSGVRGEVDVLGPAFEAARVLLAATRQGLVLAPLRHCARLCCVAPPGAVPWAERLETARMVLRRELPRDLSDELMQMLRAWLAEDEAPAVRFELELSAGVRLFGDWRYRELLALLVALRRDPEARTPQTEVTETLLWAWTRRGLGLADVDDAEDERALVELRGRAEAAGRTSAVLALGVNLAFLKGQYARPDAMAEARRAVDACTTSSWMRAFGQRELARIEVEAGLFGAGIEHYAAAVERFTGDAPRDALETRLEAIATRLEAAQVEAARAELAALPWWRHAPFQAASAGALGRLLARLSGEYAAPVGSEPRTDTVEDAAFELLGLAAAGWDEAGVAGWRAGVARHAEAARYSTRVRQARRIGEAMAAVVEGQGLAVALDGTAFRRGAAWVSVAARPVAAALLGALTAAWLRDPRAVVDKDALGRSLWPGERIPEEQRDNRLFVAITGLRKLGLGDALVHEGSGWRLASATGLVRCHPSFLPDRVEREAPAKAPKARARR